MDAGLAAHVSFADSVLQLDATPNWGTIVDHSQRRGCMLLDLPMDCGIKHY